MIGVGLSLIFHAALLITFIFWSDREEPLMQNQVGQTLNLRIAMFDEPEPVETIISEPTAAEELVALNNKIDDPIPLLDPAVHSEPAIKPNLPPKVDLTHKTVAEPEPEPELELELEPEPEPEPGP